MKRGALLVVALATCALSAARAEPHGRTRAIADAITEIDVEAAKKLLADSEGDSPNLAFERARLAIYIGDCDGAAAILSSPSLSATPEGAALGRLAQSCAGATAGALVVEDEKHGIWLRLQDDRDRVLVPFIVDVAVRSRQAIGRDLGVDLPRPLRIDLVRDLFSLAAVSGLPLEAAETTGTVAVARWGRVTMISPRATALGYPWEDTLAHEITHLLLSRATRDHAPLWLQEGIAKREETRWRSARPFDDASPADQTARRALLEGRSVGVDKLGPSIAMLPTPEAASIAFAEVTSFMSFWVDRNGAPALALLLHDLKGTRSDDPSDAMRSVTGYDLSVWIARWQAYLRDLPAAPEPAVEPAPRGPSDLARQLRLGDLGYDRGHAAAAAAAHLAAIPLSPREPTLHFRAARSLYGAGDAERADAALGELSGLRGAHGGWFALHGRRLAAGGDRGAADRFFRLGVALDPLAPEVACEGQAPVPAPPGVARPAPPPLPRDAARRALCEAARKAPQN